MDQQDEKFEETNPTSEGGEHEADDKPSMETSSALTVNNALEPCDSEPEIVNSETQLVTENGGVPSPGEHALEMDCAEAVTLMSTEFETKPELVEPLQKTNGESKTIQSQSITYGNGSKPGDVILRFNCDNSKFWEERKQTGVKWPIDTNPLQCPVVTQDTKYMYQQTQEIAMVFNDKVLEMGTIITKSYSLGPAADLRESSQNDVYIGRIRSDSGKLSAGAVLLEGTMENSSGHLIQLDLSNLDEYFIFSGQVLGLSGMNKQGRCIEVSKLHIPRPLPLHEGRISINTATGSLSVLIAAGPFTTRNSLAFEPLTDLINVLDKTRPDICFLIGPFLDYTHPMLADDSKPLNESFLKIFNKRLSDVASVVNSFQKPTKIIVVSSWKEAHHHPVYPTLPYNTATLPNIVSLPDPGTVSIGGILFSATSTDILMHLSRNEVACSASGGDRMGRLAKHLLNHRNFYPLYPPDESVPFDGPLWGDYAQMHATPHVLILPSDLRHFIKDVNGTLVINPERMSKGMNGGSYARILIDLPNDPEDSSGVGDGSPITEFVAGEIVKI